MSFIADAVICLLTLIFFIVILAKKRNVRLLVVSVLYIGAFATTSVFCELTDGKMFFIASTVLRYMLIFFMVAFCVVYQSDLKALFTKLESKSDEVHYATHGNSEDDLTAAADEIVKATQVLSRNDTGALIVVCAGSVPVNVVETGTRLNCVVSSAVLESIFNTKSPLHDGAVIIKNNTILSAGCFLPLTQRTDLARDMGTRHRAAIGIAEESNVLAIVVSEESGIVSVVRNKNEIKRYVTSEHLTQELENVYGISHIVKNQIRRK
ncbi:MAG: DNA integrity scanning protein DisA nucleotide-binding domain protein [Clostridia bacterium]|nr:DNA integrity scanning protein DisA nucleotide-binding domain protein [Clostridia bacterium]